MLCQQKAQPLAGLDINSSSLESLLDDLALPAQMSNQAARSITPAFEKRAAAELQRYENRVWQEIDPETASRLQEAETEANRLQSALDSLRAQIDTEKSLQEHILREFRAQFGTGAGRRSKSNGAQSGRSHRPSSGSGGWTNR